MRNFSIRISDELYARLIHSASANGEPTAAFSRRVLATAVGDIALAASRKQGRPKTEKKEVADEKNVDG